MPYLLLIEDEARNRTMLVQRLMRQFPGYGVIEAATLEDARRLLDEASAKDNRPSAILLDGSMSDDGTLDTLDFIAEVRQKYQGPIIAISLPLDFRRQMVAAGCSAQASKFEREALANVIREQLTKLPGR